MHLFCELVFRGILYIFFGICMEVLVSSIHIFLKEGINRKTIVMEGNCSIWMSVPYALCFLFLLEPAYKIFGFLPIWIQFIIFGLLFCLVEWVLGWIFYRVFGMIIWDYSNEGDSIKKFTRISLFWQWGFCFLLLLSYSKFALYISQFVPAYFGY